MKYPNLAILIPCFNEEECIAHAVSAAAFTVMSLSLTMVVSMRVIKSHMTLGHEHCGKIEGYGNAIMTGMLEAKRLGMELALVLDADLSDNPGDIPILVEPILHEDIDLCLSSRTRQEDQKHLEPHQRLGNQLAVKLIHWKTGYKYRDMGPFRAFNIQTLLDLHLQDENFGWNIEMQMKAAQKGLNIREIELPYRKRFAGTSKISGNIKNSIKAGLIIVRSVWTYS